MELECQPITGATVSPRLRSQLARSWPASQRGTDTATSVRNTVTPFQRPHFRRNQRAKWTTLVVHQDSGVVDGMRHAVDLSGQFRRARIRAPSRWDLAEMWNPTPPAIQCYVCKCNTRDSETPDFSNCFVAPQVQSGQSTTLPLSSHTLFHFHLITPRNTSSKCQATTPHHRHTTPHKRSSTGAIPTFASQLQHFPTHSMAPASHNLNWCPDAVR